MHGPGAGEDVSLQPPIPPAPVCNDPTGFFDEQAACRDVPRGQRQLEEPVEDAGRDPREVESRRAGSSQILEA